MTDRREPYPLEEPDVTIGELVGRITDDLNVMLRDHIELAKRETVAEAKKAARAVGLLGGGAVAGWIAALMLSLAGALALALVMEGWLAFLIVGLVWMVVAAMVAVAGRNELRDVDPEPSETVQELREDKEWLREQTS